MPVKRTSDTTTENVIGCIFCTAMLAVILFPDAFVNLVTCIVERLK